ncbi:FG-GAP-like repeat-containing protein [Micromonospora globispora]|uniref:FG-GAP-like repeat-containing protein n=1 Tax=Micromonospora globispora TaxID=1450148 RepID=UPI001FAF62F0|nr:FG-GAP-like repeat-containing protein [Micromonospora globispora]
MGFGDAGVYVARSRGNGSFSFTPEPVIADFGFEAGGWRVEKHPRFLADVTGEGRADIVGFGDAGVYVARSRGNGSFSFTPEPVIADFGFEAGGWRVEKHPRFLADITGDGRADIVGFGDAGVYVARSNANGSFSFTPEPVIADFGFQAGRWRVEKHPRLLADITGDGRADIIGFGDAGVYVTVASRGPFEAPRFVLPNFGFEVTVLAVMQSDRESQEAGVWRSSDRGATWAAVHAFPRDASAARLPGAGQLVWAPGTANLVYAAGGSSLAISTDAGATFVDVMPTPQGGFQPVNHVAVATTPAGSAQPRVVYALTSGKIFVSFDAGMTWTEDRGGIPGMIGGAVGLANSQNDRVMVVSPRSPLEVFATGNANLAPPQLWRGDYSQFEQTNESQWQPVPLPNLGGQDSGNVFVAATQPGHGNALFYGPQRPKAFVGPLDPASASDWHELDEGHHVHVDLHGIFLSPDFAATFEDGAYVPTAGTVWMASDGGISRSTDGGRNFHAAGSITTLSVVNMAGVALPGAGPVISLNTGDNDGFASPDGGRTWRPQNYGGGDNDCSWADPLRPTSMLVFTPRWDTNGDFVGGGLGQTLALYEAAPGNLPDISSSADRQMIPGPALRRGSTIWNASSGFGIRGFRPIVLNMPGDDPGQSGDCVFIRFFGNFSSPQTGTLPNNLAVLLRARNIRDVKERTDWDTPGRWRVEKHPRLLADLTADRRGDIVGFGDAGVWTAVSTSGGSFADPHFVLADFGYDQGWRVEKHPRLLADVTGSGRADIVGFGDAGVYLARSNGDGSFAFTPVPVIADFGFEAGGWRVEKHPRLLADITGDGRADVVGFGDAGVYVARSNGDGTFAFTPVPVIADFGFEAGGWRVDRHPRFLADVTGDGRADIVGFGDAGVYVALSNGDGTFQPPRFVLADFGYDQGWRVEKHPRFLADVTGEGRADIVGFGDAGVYVARSNGDGTFAFTPVPVIADFGFEAGGWRVEKHPRFLADVTGEGRADIVGFGDAGVYVARSNGDGTFAFTPEPVIADFGFEAGGWRVEKHPRFLADVTGDGSAEIVGFGDAGVLVGLDNSDGTFQPRPLFVIPNFGYGDNGPVEQQGPFLPDPNVGIVQASGGYSGTVFFVGGDDAARLWKWTDGMAAWQQLVPGGGASQARRFFVNPYDPSVIYLLDTDHVMRSDDGGVTWQVDASLEQQLTCGGRIPAGRDEDADGQGDHYDVVLSDMQFDPLNAGRRFAVGLGGAFLTTDGVNWQRLLDTGAMRGRPANCYFDWISQPSDPALYVSFAGRSIVKISGFGPRRRPPVRTADGHVGTTRPLPDDRVLLELDDGRSLVVDADQLQPQDDGTYLI